MAGVAINPHTPVSALSEIIEFLYIGPDHIFVPNRFCIYSHTLTCIFEIETNIKLLYFPIFYRVQLYTRQIVTHSADDDNKTDTRINGQLEKSIFICFYSFLKRLFIDKCAFYTLFCYLIFDIAYDVSVAFLSIGTKKLK